MPEHYNKARREGYDPPPFYYLDKREDYARIVAWSSDAEQMSAIFYALLLTFPEEVDVLLKLERKEEHLLDGMYERYFATVPRFRVVEVIGAHLPYVFGTSGHVLCLRKPEEPEYMALDEFGTLFYYTDSNDDFPIFESCGFVNKEHPFVDEGGCYVKHEDEAETWCRSFIESLRLEPVSQEPQANF